MPGRPFHSVKHLIDELLWYPFMEKITHRVDENLARATPVKRLVEALRPQGQVESAAERVTRYPSEALRQTLGIAVVASRADLGTAGDRVPGGVGPLDFRAVCHLQSSNAPLFRERDHSICYLADTERNKNIFETEQAYLPMNGRSHSFSRREPAIVISSPRG